MPTNDKESPGTAPNDPAESESSALVPAPVASAGTDSVNAANDGAHAANATGGDSPGVALAERATTAKKLDAETVQSLEEAIAQLSPAEARAFNEMVGRAIKKRRILFTGYMLSMLAMIVGTAFALYTFGTREPGEFVAWAWLVPFASVAVIFSAFGAWAKRL